MEFQPHSMHAVDLRAYQDDDYLADLRIRSSQQGENHGVPTIQDKEEGRTSPPSSFTNSKVQAMAQIVETSQN